MIYFYIFSILQKKNDKNFITNMIKIWRENYMQNDGDFLQDMKIIEVSRSFGTQMWNNY